MPDSVTSASARRGAVFAAGHLGELTWQIPVELVDAVLAETRTAERRLRALPSRVGVYFVLALCLFPGLGYRKVWAKLSAAPPGRKTPSAKAFRDLRRRLGAAPMRALFEVLAGPVATPHTPGVRFGRYRTVAFDGCVWFKVPDTDRNRSWLGKLRASLGTTGYPVIRLMTVVETGTRALLGAVFGAPATGEIDYARMLLPLLRTDMLVLVDRGFDAEAFLTDLAGTGAQFLARLRTNRKLPVLARLDDGSHLSRIGELTVRIITADLTVSCADGTRYTATYRLATTLCDPRRHPAGRLIAVYHERWEHEIAYLALHHTLAEHRVLRSADPAGLEQELWALLAVYQALRRAMVTAIDPTPSRHRPGPGQLHHRPRNRQRPAGQRRQRDRRHRPRRPHRPSRARRPAPARDGHAPASARSNPRSRATTRKTPTGPTPAPGSPASPPPSTTPTRNTRHANRNR